MKRSKNIKLPTTYKTTSFLQDPKDSACTYEIWEKKKKEEKNKKKKTWRKAVRLYIKDLIMCNFN